MYLGPVWGLFYICVRVSHALPCSSYGFLCLVFVLFIFLFEDLYSCLGISYLRHISVDSPKSLHFTTWLIPLYFREVGLYLWEQCFILVGALQWIKFAAREILAGSCECVRECVCLIARVCVRVCVVVYVRVRVRVRVPVCV